MNSKLAKKILSEANYSQATRQYEQALQKQPNSPVLCAYLGLAYLLDGEESTAHLVWLNSLMGIPENISERWIKVLVSVLLEEAISAKKTQNFQDSWIIHQHIRELDPANIENLLHLLKLTIQLGEFYTDLLSEWGLVEVLDNANNNIDSSLIESTLKDVLKFASVNSIEFAEACIPFISAPSVWVNLLINSAKEISFERKLSNFAAMLMELCLKHIPDHWEVLSLLPQFYIDGKQYKKAILASYDYYQRYSTGSLEIQLYSHSILLKSLLSAGQWKDILDFKDGHKALLTKLFQEQSINLTPETLKNLLITASFLAYIQDNLSENRWFQNQAAQLVLKNIHAIATEDLNPITLPIKGEAQRLRIGYIASTLRKHSVGYLSRWLFQAHDRNAFEISLYLVSQRPEDNFFADWFAPYVDHYTFLDNDITSAVDIIRNDRIDILIDLDSVTSDITTMILALKPAPIQATWLGYDASGLSTIDYFIADPYVLAEDAQQYYQEKIWRLPQTYIAISGFEVGVPTRQRANLNIPNDAIVYLSSQGGSKRHPDTFKLQLQILREVPNSIFLIKGLADQGIIQEYVISLAKEVGISVEQLRFLDWMSNEAEHRANLQIADIVLDTYPYNGATTTLETLWLGIPLVTRVGSTFSSRNSYAFLMNVGVTEGIAWTDEGYVEWGIQFGQDENLRQQVAWKLKQSRHTSPLWNANQFTREMENAYREMWAIHSAK